MDIGNDDDCKIIEPKSKKQKHSWECSVCLESKFPFIGICGHCVCEECVVRITNCPTCKKINSFIRPIPNWDLANELGLKKQLKKEILKFKKSNFENTAGEIILTTALFESLNDGEITSEQMKNIYHHINNIQKKFKKEFMDETILNLIKEYETGGKLNPTKIIIDSNLLFKTSQIVFELKTQRPDFKDSYSTKNVIYIKPILK